MLPPERPDRIYVAFDDHRLVANAGLLLPVTLAHHLGLGELVVHHVDLGDAPGRANAGDKMLTLVASALAGGDCIDDAHALRAGGAEQVLGCVVKAPSTLGTFLRSFRWGHVRQLDRVSRELLARAWAAGAGPGDGPLTIDLDSTICETFGLAKEGAQRHNYSGQQGYHPLLAVAAGTGDVLMSRLRQGRANTARGAAHFLRETVGRVRHVGATGPLTVRADSGFYTHAIVAVCRKTLEADHRRHAEVENAIRDLKYGVGLNHLPSGRFPANGAWLAVQVMAHNLARWTGHIALDETAATTKTLRWRFFSLAGRLTRSARRLTLPQGWPWQNQFSSALPRLRALPLPS